MQFRTHALWDIPDAFALRLIACKSAACFVHVHHCAMHRSVSLLFTFARRRLCFLLGSLMVLLGSTFLCSLFLATKERLCPPRCLSRRQYPSVWKCLLQMATLLAVCSFPRCIHAPWVWSLTVSFRSSWSLAMSLPDFVISFFAMVKQSSFACLGQGHTR